MMFLRFLAPGDGPSGIACKAALAEGVVAMGGKALARVAPREFSRKVRRFIGLKNSKSKQVAVLNGGADVWNHNTPQKKASDSAFSIGSEKGKAFPGEGL